MMFRRVLIVLFCCLSILMRDAANAASLEEGFAHPPRAARPLVWWHWVSGNISKEGIRADLEAMKRCGIGGAQMFDVDLYLPHGPVPYGTDVWHEHVQYAMRVAQELGLEFMSMNCAGWSQSAGPWITPEKGMKTLVWTETEVDGGQALRVALPQPKAKLDFYRDVAVLAVPDDPEGSLIAELTSKNGMGKPVPKKADPNWEQADPHALRPEQVLDLSASFKDGTLTWQAPAGKWTVLRIGYTATGAKNHPATPTGLGLEVDKFDPEAVAFHFEHGLGRILREAGPLAGQTFTGILFDSWEAGMQNWTERFPELFRQRRGYDLRPFLPCLAGRVVGSRGESEAFLADFRKTLGELYASEHYGTIARLAHGHGLKVFAEAYGGSLDEASAAEAVDVPMAEFWIHQQSLSCQVATSLAHTTGKPVVAAESFTARPPDGRWRETPAILKPLGDAAFITGINRFCLHTWALQPRLDLAPGFSSGRYGTHFGRLNSWWDLAPAWIEYLARCQFLLQSGQSVKDLLYLRHEGLDPSGLKDYPEPPAGYGADYLAVKQFLEAKVEGGAVRLASGAVYRALVLPQAWSASLATLKKLESLAAGGVPVFGPAPVCPAGLIDLRQHAPEWKVLVAKLWGGGGVYPVAELAATLPAKGIAPDFHVSGEGAGLDIRFAHRTADGAEIYFISNQAERAVTIQADFRVGDRAPELWDAVSGQHVAAAAYRVEKGRVALPLALEKAGSVFIVFRRPMPENWYTSIIPYGEKTSLPNALAMNLDQCILIDPPTDYTSQSSDGMKWQWQTFSFPWEKPISLAGPWRLDFPPGRGAPASLAMDRLTLLSQNPDSGIRYFSGLTTYTTSFTFPAVPEQGLECLLDLGEVHDLAAVWVNGVNCGTLWTAPWTVRVTPHLRAGRNELKIAVANTWVNRLIGDEALPPDAVYEEKGSIFTVGRLLEFPKWWNDPAALKARRRVTFPVWRHYKAADPLLPSGLAGPVRIRYAVAIE